MPRLEPTTAKMAVENAEPADLGSDPIPEGLYKVRLVGAELRTLTESKSPKLNGSQMFVFDFAIVEGPYAKLRFPHYCVIPKDNSHYNSARMFRKVVNAFEVLGGTIEDDDTDDLLGRECAGFIEVVTDWRTDAKPDTKVNRLEELHPLSALNQADAPDDEDDF